jgi:hypothetical protein
MTSASLQSHDKGGVLAHKIRRGEVCDRPCACHCRARPLLAGVVTMTAEAVAEAPASAAVATSEGKTEVKDTPLEQLRQGSRLGSKKSCKSLTKSNRVIV